MTVAELSGEYRKSGELCRVRAEELGEKLKKEKMCEMDKLRLRRKIHMLSNMARDAIATSNYLENYYGDEKNERKKAEYVC